MVQVRLADSHQPGETSFSNLTAPNPVTEVVEQTVLEILKRHTGWGEYSFLK
jgi:hypothetical protein